MGREQRATTLECILTEAMADVNINWMVKDLGAGGWKLVLSASERDGFSGGASKPSMRLADPNFLLTGNFSLLLQAGKQDAGLYMCLIEQERKTIKKIILLAILTGRTTKCNLHSARTSCLNFLHKVMYFMSSKWGQGIVISCLSSISTIWPSITASQLFSVTPPFRRRKHFTPFPPQRSAATINTD